MTEQKIIFKKRSGDSYRVAGNNWITNKKQYKLEGIEIVSFPSEKATEEVTKNIKEIVFIGHGSRELDIGNVLNELGYFNTKNNEFEISFDDSEVEIVAIEADEEQEHNRCVMSADVEEPAAEPQGGTKRPQIRVKENKLIIEYNSSIIEVSKKTKQEQSRSEATKPKEGDNKSQDQSGTNGKNNEDQTKAPENNKQKSAKLDEKLNTASQDDATEQQRSEAIAEAGKLAGELNEEQKSKLETIKNKQERNNKKKYCEDIANGLENQMTENGVKESELSVETQNEWKRLKNKTEADTTKIKNIEQKVSKEVGEKGAEKKFNSLKTRVEEAIKSNDKSKLEKVEKELEEFINSNNVYYQAKKNEAKSQLQKLKNALNEASNDGKSWLRKEVVIPAVLIIGFLAGLIIFKRSRQKKKVKISIARIKFSIK